MTNYELAEKDYMLGMKYKDIAVKYGVTISTVKSWKTRYKWNRIEKTHTKPKKSTQNKKVRTQEKSMQVVVKPEPDGLTEKQRLFCLFYIKNFNATQAAIKAGYTENYPGETGYQLLQKTTVRKEVARLKELKKQSIMLTEDDIVERYMRIAFADMTDFADFGTESYPDIDTAGNMQIDTNGNIKMRKRNYMDFKQSDMIDGGLICEISVGKQGMKVKLEDRQKALQWLSDYFCMNPMNKHKQLYDQQKLQIDRDNYNLRKEAEDKKW